MSVTTEVAGRSRAEVEKVVDLRGMWIGARGAERLLSDRAHLRADLRLARWPRFIRAGVPDLLDVAFCGPKFRWSSSQASASPAGSGRRACATCRP